ncbi:SNF2 family DNA or RNA helicase [Rubricella aquisinus]|uniref:SNF2 family DNA or RNA helicase n=1 Tax=Rubricella aquisinus TaxID=2028108 RepID=A0A840WM56_9RHOB|nr:DEAD/DEAH box helicase [Rubricella aquisinus]MBB5516168.1 SNF2 family DNA or RNA helicase [Rubricella aquisinus]
MTDRFKTEITQYGAKVSLWRSKLIGSRAIEVRDWNSTESSLRPGLARILRLMHEGRASVSNDGLAVLIPNDQAVSLDASFSDLLGFPPVATASCHLDAHGRIDQPETRIAEKWRDSDFNIVRPKRQGAFVRYGGQDWRLTPQVYDLLNAVAGFNASEGQDALIRIRAWGPVQAALRVVTGETIEADQYLSGLTIYQAGSFALDIEQTVDGPNFLPVLMAREKRQKDLDETNAPEDGELVDETDDLRDENTDALLPQELQDDFARRRFVADRSVSSAYVVGRSQFIVLESSLQAALKVVQEKRGAPETERRRFIKNPRVYLATALNDDPSAANIFVETKQYSDRVTGLKLWDPADLPWLAKFKTAWLPEGVPIVLEGEEILLTEPPESLAERVLQAKSFGQETVNVDGREINVSALEQALEAFTLRPPKGKTADGEKPDVSQLSRDVLDIEDNIEEAAFVVAMSPRKSKVGYDLGLDSRVLSSPKTHQVDGIQWLWDAWTSGWPGVLLADDMGLGKTYQTLVFLAWRRAEIAARSKSKSPILVVAPTALLKTWIAEAELHLAPDVLGERVEAFGSGLQGLKAPKGPGWSPENALDVASLRQAGWILTTYETLATYHRAFARVGYDVAVFDEMQRVKSPTTLNTHAAKAISADFVLGLTGTPVENRLEDLWCIMDRIAPGLLGDLRRFSKDYSDAEEKKLTQLKVKLEDSSAAPPVMKRRMKEDILDGLPAQEIRTYQAAMPDIQANAYAHTVSAVDSLGANRATMLEAIHRFRGISMHPKLDADIPFGDPAAFENWANQSARVRLALEILDNIREKREKALLFVEYKAVQRTIAAGLTAKYQLSSEPMIINGDVPGHRRQPIVAEFQELPPGFNVMILSPRAAGVGLTITAANHVIHLSRWWNPAVEDQCNDRVYRIGQDKPVTVHVPLALHPSYQETSFDLKLDQLLQRKRTLSHNLLAPPESRSDVIELFSGVVSK